MQKKLIIIYMQKKLIIKLKAEVKKWKREVNSKEERK